MSDYAVQLVFVLFQELPGRRECNLVDVLVHLLGSHSYATVRNGEGVLLVVGLDVDGGIAEFSLEFTFAGDGLEFLGCIYSVGNQFPEKNLMV